MRHVGVHVVVLRVTCVWAVDVLKRKIQKERIGLSRHAVQEVYRRLSNEMGTVCFVRTKVRHEAMLSGRIEPSKLPKISRESKSYQRKQPAVPLAGRHVRLDPTDFGGIVTRTSPKLDNLPHPSVMDTRILGRGQKSSQCNTMTRVCTQRHILANILCIRRTHVSTDSNLLCTFLNATFLRNMKAKGSSVCSGSQNQESSQIGNATNALFRTKHRRVVVRMLFQQMRNHMVFQWHPPWCIPVNYTRLCADVDGVSASHHRATRWGANRLYIPIVQGDTPLRECVNVGCMERPCVVHVIQFIVPLIIRLPRLKQNHTTTHFTPSEYIAIVRCTHVV